MNNIMIKVETLGTEYDSVILSIAAVKFSFDEDDFEIFSVNCDPASSTELGLKIDPKTSSWWKIKNRENLLPLIKNRIPIQDALQQLTNFTGRNCTWWSNFMKFHFSVLENSYNAVNLNEPWNIRQLRDCNTIFQVLDIDIKSFPKVTGTNCAVSDCLTQIQALKEVLK